MVGGGYTGLWSALHAAEREPGAKIVLIEAERIGWAASGRNGGFVDASLTHGAENGKSRWPEPSSTNSNASAWRTSTAWQADIEKYDMKVDWQRTGMLAVATEAHQVPWLREAAAEGEGRFLDEAAVRAEVNSPTYRAGLFSPDTCAIVDPARLVFELARVCADKGVHIHEHTEAKALKTESGAVAVTTAAGTITAKRVVLATNVFPSLLRRNRWHTVPVYDHVLGTEPLTGEQLDRIGWRSRQGISDCGNQFHYYRLTADNRILWGGYDAMYHWGRRVRCPLRGPAGLLPARSRRISSSTFPQLDRRPVQPPLGRPDRHQHPVLRALGTGRPGADRLCQRIHRPGRRGLPLRRRRLPGPAGRPPHRAHRTGNGAQAAAARVIKRFMPSSASSGLPPPILWGGRGGTFARPRPLGNLERPP